MSIRVLPSGVVAFGLALLIVSTAEAQLPRNRNPGMQQMQPIKTAGTFVMAAQNQLQMSTNTNQKILVKFGPDTEVSVSGTAEQDYLKSGVNIEFVAEVDKNHTVQDKITHLLIITPTTDRPAGLFPPDFATPDKKDAKGDGEKAKPFGADPGIGDAPPAKGRKKKEADPFGADPFASKPSKARSSAPQFPGTFTVRGTIRMCKDGKITVSAGRGASIKAELKDDVTIDVDMADLRAAQPDDRITVDGFANQGMPNMVLAKSIKIELANPLSARRNMFRMPRRRPRTAPRRRKMPAMRRTRPIHFSRFGLQ